MLKILTPTRSVHMISGRRFVVRVGHAVHVAVAGFTLTPASTLRVTRITCWARVSLDLDLRGFYKEV